MILLLSKPSGYTSFDLIRKLKKLYKGEKIGHAGTLDPMATWLMIIAIGKDTKRLSEFVWLDKTYIATIDFTKESDTWDLDYREYYRELRIENWQVETLSGAWANAKDPAMRAYPTVEEIKSHLDSKIGIHPMPLTPFSAKKIKGKKLYEYAREGNPIFIDIEMELMEYEIISYDFPELVVRLHVGSGTYIRSIAHWLGSQFYLGGILTALHRESIGPYCL